MLKGAFKPLMHNVPKWPKHLLQNFLGVPDHFGTKKLKKLYEICTNDYDDNEHFVVKHTRFFTNDVI